MDEEITDERIEVLARLEAIDRRLDELVRTQQRQQDLVHRLHEDNTLLRRGEVQEALLPLVRHLIELADQTGLVAGQSEESVAQPLASIERGILEGLRRAGVERATLAPGDPFDPERHVALGAVETDDPGLDERVAAIRRSLYVRTHDRRTVRPAEVHVHRFVTAPAPEPVGDDGSVSIDQGTAA